jgi:protein TonB
MRRRQTAAPVRYVLLALGETPALTTLFDQRGSHAGGAFGSALAAHGLLLLVVWGMARVAPTLSPSTPAVPSSIARFIFTADAAQGSGRSGGGNRSADPAAPLRTRGPDQRSVAAASPTVLATPDTISPERDGTPVLAVTPMDAGAFAQIGPVDGLPGAPNDARGPGETGRGTRIGTDRGLGDRAGSDIGDGPYGIGNGVTAPILINHTQPQYTAEAMRAKLGGVAVLTGIVGVDGTLHDVRVVRSLDAAFGLDQEAVACVRQWRFRPGTRQGKPVAVAVSIEVAFNLR